MINYKESEDIMKPKYKVIRWQTDGTEEIETKRRGHRDRALKSSMAVFDETYNAASGLAAVAAYERFLNRAH